MRIPEKYLSHFCRMYKDFEAEEDRASAQKNYTEMRIASGKKDVLTTVMVLLGHSFKWEE
ncbi:MAG: hypothetical protein ACE3JK_01850 [Sporolactobacillus sp.]